MLMCVLFQWATPEATEDARVHQQKLRVVYLPPEGQTLEEEDETQVNMSSMLSTGESVCNLNFEPIHWFAYMVF